MSHTHTFIDRAELLREIRRSPWHRSGVLAEPMLRTPDEYRRMVEALRAAIENGTASGHIDHSPGGSPDPFGPSADAPEHTLALWYRPMSRTLLAERTGAPSEYVSAADALARIREAARRYTSGGYWAAEDCADYMLTRLMERAAEHAAQGTGRVDNLPARDLTPLSLSRMATDWARREATRQSESLERAAESTGDALTPDTVQAQESNGSPALSPDSARRLADSVCNTLGVGALGGVFEVLYCALRDTDTDECARELGTTPGTMRKRLSRGAGWLKKTFPSPVDLYRALEPYRDAPGSKPKRHTLGRARAAGWSVRTGTNAGHAPVRAEHAEHARALCLNA